VSSVGGTVGIALMVGRGCSSRARVLLLES